MSMSQIKPLEEIIKKLTPDEIHAVEGFANSIWEKRFTHKRQKPKFEWAGCLKDYEPSKSSVDIQHEIADWRMKNL